MLDKERLKSLTDPNDCPAADPAPDLSLKCTSAVSQQQKKNMETNPG